MAWQAALAAGGGSLLSFIGQERANRSNRQMSREAMQHESREAQLNRNFQERMSSTARQRDVADLRRAGFNPMLAVNGGSSTPSGAQGDGHAAQAENSLEGIAHSALAAARLKADLKNIKADTRKKKAEAKAVEKTHPQSDVLNKIYKSAIEPIIDGALKHGAKIKYEPEWKQKPIKNLL